MAKPDQWGVSTNGHKGDINVGYTSYQVIYVQSDVVAAPPLIFGGRNYATIENDGPAPLRVWIDTMATIQLTAGLAGGPTSASKPHMDPQGAGMAPTLVLRNGQSATVQVAGVVLVRSAGRRGSRGNYVISWCCPNGINVSLTESAKEYKEEIKEGETGGGGQAT